MRLPLAFLLSLAVCAFGAERLQLVRPAQYSGMCDASAAVVASSNLFIVANDEDNILRLYRSDRPGPPVKQFDFDAFLEVVGKSTEADLEASARIGERVFWMGSHGRNRKGKERDNRCRLFATDLKMQAGEVSLVPVGQPCKRLLEDLLADARFNEFHLATASLFAPKESDALNIEGLAATPEGHLLIGFRNPIPRGKALLIPLLNPNQVVTGSAAMFGPAILLDLGGLGIRDIAFHGGTYLIIAGSYDAGGRFQIFRWAGPGAAPTPVKVNHLNRYNPEALVIDPERGFEEFMVLSDDGTKVVDGCLCKALPDPRQKAFRSFWLTH